MPVISHWGGGSVGRGLDRLVEASAEERAHDAGHLEPSDFGPPVGCGYGSPRVCRRICKRDAAQLQLLEPDGKARGCTRNHDCDMANYGSIAGVYDMMFRQQLKRIPGLQRAVRLARAVMRSSSLKIQSTEQVFSRIYRTNSWGSDSSMSGPGSEIEQTKTVIAILETVIRAKGITRVLDVPCGDFHWMQQVNLNGVDYIGGDIVAELIERDTERFGGERVQFYALDVIRNDLPRADLVLCRDCLVHLSNAQVKKAIRNIVRSGSTWLLTTVFTGGVNDKDIAQGQWRNLNLTKAPFSLPTPDMLASEECTEGQGRYSDKSLALWKIDSLRPVVRTW